MALSKCVGILDAIEFAYGQPGSGAPALQVIEGSNGTGAYTVKCAPTQLQTSAGVTIPISTNTPIAIGADSSYEVVTPSAVSVDSLGHYLITATFTYAHGTGAQVRSGDGGLQEAAQFATNQGGGLVALTPGYFKLMGLSFTNKTALGTFLANYKSLSASVTLLDYSGATGTTGSTEALSYLNATVGSAYAATTHILY